MDIREWNSIFVLMGGSVVCSGCMAAQPLADTDKQFAHSRGESITTTIRNTHGRRCMSFLIKRGGKPLELWRHEAIT